MKASLGSRSLQVRGSFRGVSGHDHRPREFARHLVRLGVRLELTDLPQWHPVTPAQLNTARQLALSYGVTVETTVGALRPGEISDGVTALGIVIALSVLAASVSLIRSETARYLRTLTATGASATTRRTITAATAADRPAADGVRPAGPT